MSDFNININPVDIEGEKCITVTQFALIVGKTPQAIYYLVKNGKNNNKIESRTYLNTILIPISEVTRIKEMVVN